MKKLYYLILILGIIGLITLLVSCPEEGDGFEDTEAESSYSGSGDEVFHIDTNEAVDLTHTLHLGSHVADIYYVFTNTNPYTNMLHPEIMSKGDTIVESRDLSSQLGIERTGPVGRNGKPEIAAYNRDVHALLEKDSSSRDVAVLPDGPMKDDEGQEEDFYYDLDGSVFLSI